jgi:hypothetical protein
MVTRTVVCPDCGETVPYGRLSCPACGTLLAAVAGAPRRSRPLAAVAVSEAPTLDDTVTIEEPLPRPAAPRRAAAGPRHEAVTAADDAPLALAAHHSDDHGSAPPADREPATMGGVAADEVVAPVGHTPPVLQDWPEASPATLPIPATPAEHRYEHEQGWDTEDGTPPASAFAEPPHPTAAGAYVPPTEEPPTAEDDRATLAPTATPVVAGGPAYVRTAATPMRPFGASIQPGMADRPPTEPHKPLRAGDAPLLADLPFDAPDTLTGWLITGGAGLAALSFILPWTGGAADYFLSWGLAATSRVLAFISVLALLWLSMTPNRLPSWVRSAVVPLVLGGVMLGLVWSSLFSGRPGLGVFVALAGSILLVVGGILTVRPMRHADTHAGV